MKIVTSLQTLFYYAGKLGEAKKTGNREKIEKAQAEHDVYVEMCLHADEMSAGMTIGYLNSKLEKQRGW